MDKRGYYVSDAYRTNHLSMKPGGVTIVVYYADHFRAYDKIKYPQAYIEKLVDRDGDILRVEIEGKSVWSRE